MKRYNWATYWEVACPANLKYEAAILAANQRYEEYPDDPEFDSDQRDEAVYAARAEWEAAITAAWTAAKA